MSPPDLNPQLPLTRTVIPADPAALAAEVRAAFESKTAIYPIGGGTALGHGMVAKTPGVGLSTAALDRVIDYPARDMTITVEAGITMAKLAEVLAAEGQQLPIDVPFPQKATLAGVIATNWSGPRRYGHGTMRDYVIGISAVDGRGVAFKAGGRVVKNVAGYDFCKLLTGSLGTLAVITQVTLKVKPIPEAVAAAVWETEEQAMGEIFGYGVQLSRTTPVAVEFLGGAHWAEHPLPNAALNGDSYVTFFEGTREEVDWMTKERATEHSRLKFKLVTREVTGAESVNPMGDALTMFPTIDAPLVVRFGALPGQMNVVLWNLLQRKRKISFQAHAGNGILNVAFHDVSPDDIPRLLREELQPLAARDGGSVTVLHAPGVELSRELVWGPPRSDHRVMQVVKEKFDPAGILNPGRFVY